jgi:VanZ family protein
VKAVARAFAPAYGAAMSRQRLLILAFWSAALFALVMASVPRPPEFPGEPGDKVQHMMAFATLAVLGSAAYPRLALWKLLAGLACFGAFIELVQMIPALHRDSELADLLADTAAAAVILLIVHLLRRRRRAG